MAGKVMGGGGLGDEETKCVIILHWLLHGHHSVHSIWHCQASFSFAWPHIHLPSTMPCWIILQRLLPHHTNKPHQFILLIVGIERRGFHMCPTEIGWSCVHVLSFYAPCRCEIASTGTWSRMSAASFLTLSAMSMANTYRVWLEQPAISYVTLNLVEKLM